MTERDEADWRSYDARYERAEAVAAAFREKTVDPGLHRHVGSLTGDRHQPAPDMVTLLAFEEANPGTSGAKADRIRTTFNLNETRYYQALLRTIDTPEALEHNPMLVHRLRDHRDRRTQARATRTFPTR